MCRVLVDAFGVVTGRKPLRTSAEAPCNLCFLCKAVGREGSVQAKHPELLGKTSTRPAISVRKWFKTVRGGSL